MKTLYIVRHAKSDWGDESLKDVDRHLNSRGYADAYLMSTLFGKQYPVPELLLSSPAIRALSTALIFARTMKYNEKRIQLKREIYEAHESTLHDLIAGFDESFSTVMLFGHNPGLTDLFNSLSDQFIDNIPTCGIMGLSFDTNTWNKINSVQGETLFTLFPKEIKP